MGELHFSVTLVLFRSCDEWTVEKTFECSVPGCSRERVLYLRVEVSIFSKTNHRNKMLVLSIKSSCCCSKTCQAFWTSQANERINPARAPNLVWTRPSALCLQVVYFRTGDLQVAVPRNSRVDTKSLPFSMIWHPACGSQHTYTVPFSVLLYSVPGCPSRPSSPSSLSLCLPPAPSLRITQ